MSLYYKFRSVILVLRGRKVAVSARIGKGVSLSKAVQIGEKSAVGNDTSISGNVKVGRKVVFGRNICIKGDVIIEDNCRIGDNVTINVFMSGKVRIGTNSFIQKNVDLGGNISIGANSTIGSNTIIKTMPDAQLMIGNDVLVNHFSVLGASEKVEIGNHCIFAAYLQITDAEHSFDDIEVPIKHAPYKSSPVVIEENVWLGSAVTVLMGCRIGKGSVIGAKSMVNEDIPPYSIAFGTPAKVKRTRA
jgi:acetyltransferase-like isoleucine patch superfamily enzyme